MLCTRLTTLFRRGPAVPASCCLGDFCDTLAASQEYMSDNDVVIISRLQIIASRLDMIIPVDWADGSVPALSTAMLMGINGIDREMEEELKAQPSAVRERGESHGEESLRVI